MANSARPRAAVILAAGKSTRMKSVKSKVLHELAGRPLLGWVHALASTMGCERMVCVVGEANADVRAEAERLGMDIAVQEPQQGTGHAVQCAADALAGFDGDVAVLYADTPLISQETLASVFEALGDADVAVLGFEADIPGAYGRLVETGGELEAIVEAKEATPEQLAITLCNSGVIAADCKAMFKALERVTNDNIKGEYYLTDVIGLMREDGGKAVAVQGDEAEMLGVNDRVDLASAHKAFQEKTREAMLKNGVTLRDPDSVYFAYDTEIERDAVIGENVVFGPGVRIASHAIIQAFSHIEGTSIGEGAVIGPFARLRPGTNLAEGAKIGNFVETKKANIGRGSKVNHLTYIGDAEIGEGANIGAGTVTCNYDGYFKHKTVIGNGAFIGTHTSLVAPVRVGNGAFTGTGAVVTQDVPDDALALARAKQVNKDGWAARYHGMQAAKKAKQNKA